MTKQADKKIDLDKNAYPPGSGDFCVSFSKDQPQFAKCEKLLEAFSPTKDNECPYVEEEIPLALEKATGRTRERIQARAMLSYSQRRTRINASFRVLNQKKTPKDSGFEREWIQDLQKLYCSEPNKDFLFWADSIGDHLLMKLGMLKESKNVTGKIAIGGECEIGNFHPQGLIVVAGATGTGKSVVATSLILRYLLRFGLFAASKNQAPPHLVSFEDPLESAWSFYVDVTKKCGPYSLREAQHYSPTMEKSWQNSIQEGKFVAFTGREKGKDVTSLEMACRHALRQKPTIFYVGEVRDPEEWKEVLHLAGTGHLVVTTCHASTLVDTFMKIAGKRCDTAEGRHAFASCLSGVIHMKNHQFDWAPIFSPCDGKPLSENPKQALLSLWRRTNESVSNFVVDGLSSIFPDGDNVLSYSSITKSLINLQKDSLHAGLAAPEVLSRLMAQARQADLSI